MKEEINKLDTWLKKHRIDFYANLNDPVSDITIKEIEESLSFQFPDDFKFFLKWKNGQSQNEFSGLHPLTNEMFLELSDSVSICSDYNELLEFGDVDEGIWKKTWFPFMSNGGGDYSCIELSKDNYGAIISHNHEEPDGAILHSSIRDWLIELNQELETLNFDSWDFDECQNDI